MRIWTLCLAASLGLASPAFAWTFEGTPLLESNHNASFVLLPDGTGGYLAGVGIQYPPGETNMRASRVSADGTKLWTWIGPGGAHLAGDGAGGAYALPVSSSEAWLHHSLSSGTTDPVYGFSGSTLVNTTQIVASGLVSDGAGGAYALVSDYGGDPEAPNDGRIVAWRYINGEPVPGWTSTGNVVRQIPGEGTQQFVAIPDGGHGLLVGAWSVSNNAPYTHSMTVTRMLADGSVPWSSLATTEHSSPGVQLALLRSSDHVFFLWKNNPNTDSIGVRLQCFDLASGARRAGWPAHGIPVVQGPGDSLSAMLGSDGVGGVYVGWAHGTQVKAIRYTSAGTRSSGWSAEGVDLLGPGAVPYIDSEFAAYANFAIASSSDGLIALWTDRRVPTRFDIFARWLLPDGTPDPAQPNAGRGVCPGPAFLLTAISDDNHGAFVGLAGGAGGSFPEYRMSWLPYNSPWVGVADPTRLAAPLELRAWPNPARDALTLQFRAVDANPVRIELVDVAGHRARMLESRAAGDQTRRFEHLDELPAGVYFVRIVQGGVSRSQRVALVH